MVDDKYIAISKHVSRKAMVKAGFDIEQEWIPLNGSIGEMFSYYLSRIPKSPYNKSINLVIVRYPYLKKDAEDEEFTKYLEENKDHIGSLAVDAVSALENAGIIPKEEPKEKNKKPIKQIKLEDNLPKNPKYYFGVFKGNFPEFSNELYNQIAGIIKKENIVPGNQLENTILKAHKKCKNNY